MAFLNNLRRAIGSFGPPGAPKQSQGKAGPSLVHPGDIIEQMDDSESARKLVTFIDAKLSASRALRLNREQYWTRTMGHINGLFDIQRTSDGSNLMRLLEPDARSRAVSENFAAAFTLQRMSRILQMGCEFNASPENPNSFDSITAEISERLCNANLSPEIKLALSEICFYVEVIDKTALRPVLTKSGSSRVAVPMLRPAQWENMKREERLSWSEEHIGRATEAGGDLLQPHMDKGGNHVKDGDLGYFFELTADRRKMETEYNLYGTRLEVIPPWQIVWDPKYPTPSTFRDSRWFAYEPILSHSDVVDINDGSNDGVDNLGWTNLQDVPRFAEQMYALIGAGPSCANEQSLRACRVWIPPRDWCDAEYDDYFSKTLRKSVPTKCLEHGLELTYDMTTQNIIRLGTFPVSAHGKLENIVAWIQQLPLYGGCYAPTMLDLSATLCQEISMSASDISRKRKDGQTNYLVVTGGGGAGTEVTKQLGATLAVVSNRDGSAQPMLVYGGDIPMSHIRWHEQLKIDLEQLVRANVVPPDRPRTATEINAGAIQSGQVLDMTTMSYTDAFVDCGRIHLLQLQAYGTPAQIFRVRGKFNVQTVYTFRKADLEGHCTINLSAGRFMFGDPSVHMAWVERMVAMGAITRRDELVRLLRMRELVDQTFEEKARKKAESDCQRICLDPQNQKEMAYQKVQDPNTGAMVTVPAGGGWRPAVFEWLPADIMMQAVKDFGVECGDDIIKAPPLVAVNLHLYLQELKALADRQAKEELLRQNPFLIESLKAQVQQEQQVIEQSQMKEQQAQGQMEMRDRQHNDKMNLAQAKMAQSQQKVGGGENMGPGD